MGLTLSGAMELIIKSSDVGAIKASEKIVINNEEYYKWHEAIGQKFLIFTRPFGLSRVIVFRKEK